MDCVDNAIIPARKEQETTDPIHRTEQIWGQLERGELQRHLIPQELTQIRKEATIQKILTQHEPISEWIANEYTNKETKRAIVGLKTTKLMASTEYLAKHIKPYENTWRNPYVYS